MRLCVPGLTPTLGRAPSAPAQRSPRPPGAQAAPGPHLSFGGRDTRQLVALSFRGAGARESPPGVRRGHALPGPGATQRRFPARRGEPAPFYSRRRREASPSPRLGPPPPCPAPPRGDGARARAQGPWPRARCAQPSSRVFIAPRPLRLRERPGPSARRLGDRGHRVRGHRGQGRARGRAGDGPERGCPEAAFPSGEGGRRAAWAPPAGRSSLWRLPPNPGADGSPLLRARLQRETRGHALPPLRWLLDARLSRAGCAGRGVGGGPRCWLRRRGAGGDLGRGRESQAGEGGAPLSQMETQKGTRLAEGTSEPGARKLGRDQVSAAVSRDNLRPQPPGPEEKTEPL